METTPRLASLLIQTRDSAAARRFYVEGVGLEVAYEEGDFVKLHAAGVDYMLHAEDGSGPAVGLPIELWFWVDSIERSEVRLNALGFQTCLSPRDTPWGIRMAGFIDPDSHPVFIQERLVT